MIATGDETTEIARRLGTTEATVAVCRESLIAKLGARDLYGVIRVAFARGILY